MYTISAKLVTWLNNMKESAKNVIVECDAWFLVFLAVLLALAFTIYAGLQIWCIVYKGKAFTGNWKCTTKGVSVKAECR